MEKGRSLERGFTNKLYGTEVADIMERFADGPFQIQVWRDLAVARYKLYDATAMWLMSRRGVGPSTYRQVESAARDYLSETLVLDYFRRLGADPSGGTPRLTVRQVNYVTRAFSELPRSEQLETVSHQVK